MRLWKEDFTAETGLECLFTPQCKHCHIDGEFYMAKAHKFPLHDGFGHHIDVEMRCPQCGYWWPYGVAISEKHYEWFTERFGNAFN